MSRRLSVSLVTACVLLAGIGCRAPGSKVPGATSSSKKVETGRGESAQVSTAIGAGKLNILDKKVELGGAESTQVYVTIGIGKLNISGGGKGLLDARFEYEIPDWKPIVTYEVDKGFGRLEVKQPDTKVGAKTDVRYDWNLRLADKIPTDLVIEMGVGKIDLDARGLTLRRLKVTGALGEARVDLSDVSSNLNAEIGAGIGKLTLLLPSDVGVKVKTDGIGHVEAVGLSKNSEGWTSDTWGRSRVSVSVEVSGVGDVVIETVARRTI